MNDTYLILYQKIRQEFVSRFMGKMVADDYTYFTMNEVAEIIDGAKAEVEEQIKKRSRS